MSRHTPQTAPILAIGSTPALRQALAQALAAAATRPVLEGDCFSLVRQVIDAAPQQVVCHLAQGADELQAMLATLAVWAGEPPCALTVIAAASLSPADTLACVNAGVTACLATLEPVSLQLQLEWAPLQQQRQQALRAELAAARAQLDERKWIDRAKGLLMQARCIGEDDAFKLLRGAAMHANLKLAEVSRSVLDAARWAEAVNRAGQLRMLSQRLVALAAQRLAKVEPARSRSLLTLALQRARDNIEHLASLALEGEAAVAFGDVGQQWTALDAALHAAQAARADSRSLLLADQRAEALLQAADRLTDVLEAHGARRALAIVNLCGSQRMRAQRLAKDALLVRLLPDDERTQRLQVTLQEFEAVQRRIEAAPLSSPEMRAALAAVQETWLVMLRAWRAADPVAVVHAGEALLQALDHVTDSCEHSLQLLMS